MDRPDVPLEACLRAAVDTTGSVIIGLRPDHTIFFWNRAAEQLYGRPAHAVMGLDYLHHFIAPEQRDAIAADIRKVLRGEPTWEFEDDSIIADGTRRTLVWNVQRLLDNHGAPVGIIAAGHDITARKDAERSFSLVWNESSDGLLIGGGPGIIDCNPAALAMLGLTDRAQLIGRHPHEFSPMYQPDGSLSSEKARALDRATKERGEHRFQWVHARADGTPVPTEVTVRLTTMSGRTITVVSWRDRTEQEQAVRREQVLREHILRTQKLDALGHLVGGIAHDFNNMLCAIRGSLDLAALDVPSSSPAAEELTVAQETTARAAALVRQLLAVGRQGEAQREVFDCAELVSGAERMLLRLLPASHELVLQVPSEPLFVHGDRSQLEQILVNLVVNARDAMPGGGHMTVRVSLSGLPSARRACIEVSDAGVGMTPEVLERVFDPFFSTKGVGEGSGLGLAVVYGIVSAHGGTVHIVSAPGEGTRVRVELPAVAAPAHATPPTSQETQEWEARASRGETVLLVDDEPAVRAALARLLRRAGYEVLEATHGAEALTVWHEHESDVQVVVSDVRMPVMSGPEFIRHLRASGSRIPVVLMSGFAQSDLTSALARSGELDSEVLSKPFEASVLRRAVGRALRRSAA
jgi:two-component system, cell cycle sensor histidine kinase and response regulator CckA